ncbi:MAG: gliding motility-associated C-terminal domain-containing protein [bacterium]
MSSAVMAIDSAITVEVSGRSHLLSVSQESQTQIWSLGYLSSFEATYEAKVIFSSYDEIVSPEIFYLSPVIYASWETKYLDRSQKYTIISLDGGQHFGPVKQRPLFQERPTPPKILSPKNSFIIRYLSTFPEPTLNKIELSATPNFFPNSTWNATRFNLPTSPEGTVSFSQLDLPDGNYYLRGTTFNGTLTSESSAVIGFVIDRVPPIIKLLKPTEIIFNNKNITIECQVNERSSLLINGQLITKEVIGAISFPFSLVKGKNNLVLVATDEAGNSSSLPFSFSYEPERSIIQIIKPRSTDWFTAGSTILVEASVTDPQNRLEDEIDVPLFLSGTKLSETLVYDKASGRIAGFVTIPENSADGVKLTIMSLSIEGETIEKQFNINIGEPPANLTAEVNATGSISSYLIENSSLTAFSLVTGFGNGPNPFSPKNDGLMYFTYKLNLPSALSIYIFDLAGNLIWKKEITMTNSGNTAWNGVDAFGRQVQNGVYPYVLKFTSSSDTEIKKGKIIILQ